MVFRKIKGSKTTFATGTHDESDVQWILFQRGRLRLEKIPSLFILSPVPPALTPVEVS